LGGQSEKNDSVETSEKTPKRKQQQNVTNIITKNNINNFIITNPTSITTKINANGAAQISIHPSNIVSAHPSMKERKLAQNQHMITGQIVQPTQVIVKQSSGSVYHQPQR
jgi:hypothetical protein